MTAPEPNFVDRLLHSTTAAEVVVLRAELDARQAEADTRQAASAVMIIGGLPLQHLAQLQAAIDARQAVSAQRVAAHRRAAMELARESVGSEPLGAAMTIYYGVEAESRVTGTPVDEVAAGDPAAVEALEEVARSSVRTHVMRGWLDRHWDQVSDRVERILRAEAIGRGQ